LPPATVAVAVAVKRPAVSLATNAGEATRPSAPVVAVAWLLPPTKLPVGAFSACGSVNVTVTPARGCPRASSTRARSAWR
jgi:hypothetical protein